MATPDIHAQNAAPLVVGIAAIVSGIFTPEFIVTFTCAVLGSGIGMAFLPSPAPIKSRLDLFWRFLGNLFFVLVTSIVIMFSLYYLKKYVGGIDYPLAFFSSMFLMLFRERIFTAIGNWITRKIDGV